MEREINFIENALLAAMTLPRYEVIRGDIQTIKTYNDRLERLKFLKDRDEKDRQLRGAPLQSPAKFSALDLKDMVKTERYGEFYPRYHHLRVYGATDELARLVTRLAGYERDSDQFTFLRRLLRAWRDGHYVTYKSELKTAADRKKKKTENAFLDHFDVDYRLRRLNHVRSVIDDKLTALPNSTDGDLWKIRQSAEEQLKDLREEVRLLDSSTRSPLLKEEDSKVWIAELKELLPSYYARVMDEPDRTARAEAAVEVYITLHRLIDPIMDRIRCRLESVFKQNSKKMVAVLPPTIELGACENLKEVYQSFHFFHWHDVLSLTFLEGSGAREYAEAEIYRVSPADSTLATLYEKEEGKEKLVGTAVGAFGGFLQRDWREHDMMWGRLDGAERIITALLPEPKHKQICADFVQRVQDVILEEEFSDRDNRDRVFYWLVHKLREKNVTDQSPQDLVKWEKNSSMNFRHSPNAFLTRIIAPS